ncbi:class I SAM-dependent methyltransferase [Sinimarinibacterium sp. CAU 1509]|uniref:class I SAM-dependent methyltransferase n=1 Tax=Sinimarinibacterium sp. CAU 1509 TaxID=2562283 RepID=UPI00146E8C17|nr:class I SAM-dependent methyltransferase [Sinimarinibacterium sp. CAU 1509]
MSANRSERVSPTAYATGYLWYRHGLSDKALVTPQGKRLDRAFRGFIAATRLLSGISLDAMMLARHKGIDAVLMRAIDAGEVTQVIEIAAGLSARGWRMRQRYGDRITYIETDLPAMAATKRTLLENARLLGPRHQVRVLDALANEGPTSLAAIAATLDPKQGTAIITEGLMNYLAPAQANSVWQRIAHTLKQFPHGVYLADVYFAPEQRSAAMLAFGAILQVFVRGRMHVHFDTPKDARERMTHDGFKKAQVHRTRDIPATQAISKTSGADRVSVLEARM